MTGRAANAATVEPKGYFALVLHAHLPFVRHPEHERFLEEDWYFEALAETYLPLLGVLEGLERDRVPGRITCAFSPTLLSMMTDPLLQQRAVRYFDQRLEAIAGEIERTTGDDRFHPVVRFYRERYRWLRERYTEHHRLDVAGAFRRLIEQGRIATLAGTATHGYLPLLAANEESLYAQCSMGLRAHERILGQRPRGIWLPECGYRPGFDRMLAQFGFDHFFLDTHGLLHADPRPRYGVHRPLRSPGGPAAFGRDPQTSRLVWSAEHGYPGDFFYRDFYRDAAFDVTAGHIARLRHGGAPTFTGLKYYRITGRGEWKEPYHPDWARERVARHAEDFVVRLRQQLTRLAERFDRPPIVVAPYDAELFGHWWFEGPQWIDQVMRRLASAPDLAAAVAPSDCLERLPELQPCAPAESSWGAGGQHEVWLNETNDWIYPHLHAAATRMSELARRFPAADGERRRALDQAARELLLAQASDWAFILRTGTAVDYATGRLKSHLHRFHRCAELAETGSGDRSAFELIAGRDNLFPDLDYRIFCRRPWP